MKMFNLVLVASLLSVSAMASSSVVLPGDALNVKVDSIQVTNVLDHYESACGSLVDDCEQTPVYKKAVEVHVGYQSALEGRAETQEQCNINNPGNCFADQNDYEGQTFEAVATYSLDALNTAELAAAKSRDAKIVSLGIEKAPVPTLVTDNKNSQYCEIDPNSGTQVVWNCKDQIAYTAGTPVTKTFVTITFNQ